MGRKTAGGRFDALLLEFPQQLCPVAAQRVDPQGQGRLLRGCLGQAISLLAPQLGQPVSGQPGRLGVAGGYGGDRLGGRVGEGDRVPFPQVVAQDRIDQPAGAGGDDLGQID